MKLFKVNLRATGDYSCFYVIASDPTIAYNKVRKYMDDEDLCFSHDREMESIELLAEASKYPECDRILII